MLSFLCSRTTFWSVSLVIRIFTFLANLRCPFAPLSHSTIREIQVRTTREAESIRIVYPDSGTRKRKRSVLGSPISKGSFPGSFLFLPRLTTYRCLLARTRMRRRPPPFNPDQVRSGRVDRSRPGPGVHFDAPYTALQVGTPYSALQVGTPYDALQVGTPARDDAAYDPRMSLSEEEQEHYPYWRLTRAVAEVKSRWEREKRTSTSGRERILSPGWTAAEWALDFLQSFSEAAWTGFARRPRQIVLETLEDEHLSSDIHSANFVSVFLVFLFFSFETKP